MIFKTKLVLLFFITALGGNLCFADSWHDLYPGSAHMPDLGNHIDELLSYDRDQCGKLIHDEIGILNEYQMAAALSDSSGAEDKFKEFKSRILETTPPNGPCYQTALSVYLLQSVFKLDPENVNLSAQYYSKNGDLSSKNLGIRESAGYASFQNLPLTLLTAAVIDKGWVNFLETTPKIGGRDILGLYDCSSTKISVDPSMRPLNLASTFIHELTHLFFDKSISPEILKEEFSAADGRTDWHAFVLEDETIAITYAAYLQRMMSENPRSSFNYTVPGSIIHFGWTKWPYQIGDDLNFFSKKGPIDTVSRLAGFRDPLSELSTFFGSSTPLTEKFLNISAQLQQSDRAWSVFQKLRPKLLNIVNSPYFPGESISQSELEIFNFYNHGLELFPLPYFAWNHPVRTHIVSADNETPYAYFYEGKVPYFLDNEPVGKISFQGVSELIQSIDDFIQAADGESKVCSLYEDAVARGELSSYIGTKLDPDSDSTGHPGGAGVRGSTPTRPGGAGVRGNTPTRPGGAGVRGGIKSVHPCLSFKGEL